MADEKNPSRNRSKTTVEIDTELEKQTRERCAELGIPLRLAIEDGLFLWLKQSRR